MGQGCCRAVGPASEPGQDSVDRGVARAARRTGVKSHDDPARCNYQRGVTLANVKVVEDTVFDAVGEAINIVVGRAKAMLSTPGETPLQVSLPTVLRGRDYCVMSPSNSVWLDIPFVSDLGPFNLRLCFESK